MKKMTFLLFVIRLIPIFFMLSLSAEETPPPPPLTTEIQNQTTQAPTISPVAPDYEHAFLKMLGTLGGLLALVFVTVFALKKLSHGKIGGFGSQKRIQILEKRPLSPKSILYLIEIDHKQVLIAESQLEVKALTEITSTESS